MVNGLVCIMALHHIFCLYAYQSLCLEVWFNMEFSAGEQPSEEGVDQSYDHSYDASSDESAVPIDDFAAPLIAKPQFVIKIFFLFVV